MCLPVHCLSARSDRQPYTVTRMRHPLLVEGRRNCARQSLASTLSAPRVAVTSYCDSGRHANVVTPSLAMLTPCLHVPNLRGVLLHDPLGVHPTLRVDAAPVARPQMRGFTPRVVCVVLVNACGGLLCAAVIKYADNIARCVVAAVGTRDERGALCESLDRLDHALEETMPLLDLKATRKPPKKE